MFLKLIIVEILLLLLRYYLNQRRRSRLPIPRPPESPKEVLPPELEALIWPQRWILYCLLHSRELDDPELISAAADFEGFLEQTLDKWGSDGWIRKVVDAGYLVSGHPEFLEKVIEALPEITRPTGLYLTLSSVALGHVLPLPFSRGAHENYRYSEVKAWYLENKDRLVWDAEKGKFVFDPRREDSLKNI